LPFAALTYYLLPKPQYTAVTLLHVASSQPKVLFTTAEGGPDFATYQRTQLTMLKSRLVLHAALKDPQVAALDVVQKQSYPEAWFEKRVEADFSMGPEILRIAINGESPQELATLVNALAAAYVHESASLAQTHRLERLKQLKEYQTEFNAKLQAKKEAFEKEAAAAGGINAEDLAVKHRLTLEQLALEEKALFQYRSELMQIDAELAVRQSRTHAAATVNPSESEIQEQLSWEPKIQALLAKEAEKKAYLAELEKLVNKEKHAPYRRHAAELAALQEQLEALKKELRPVIVERIRTKSVRDLNGRVADLEERREVAKLMEKQLSGHPAHLTKEAKTIDKSSLELERMRDEITLTETITKKVVTELEALKLELQAPPRVTLLEEAEVPHVRDDKRRTQLSAVAGLGTFCFVLWAFAWREVHVKRITAVHDVADRIGLHVLGALPTMPRKASARLPQSNTFRDLHWYNVMLASVDATCTMLLYSVQATHLRTFMVTSAHSKEGKTMLASHLAASVARAGRKTLLIDCDLRRPSLARLFGLPAQPGLRELLQGDASLPQVVQPTALAGLSVLVTRPWDGSALHLLTQERLQALFQQTADDYDLVIVDSAPVLAVADTLLIGRHVDAVLFSILRDVSRLPAVQAAYQRLAMVGVRILGAVVSGADKDAYGYGYGDPYTTPFQVPAKK
jgi:capsular exopolysaccharide synthesis family protein